MKSEPCSFDQCRFSRVCNHIHCIRPHCSYVLHSSGQLFSHKRKHERNDPDLNYRNKFNKMGGGSGGTSVASGMRTPGSWGPDDMAAQGMSLNLNGESSNEGRGSPSYYSMDDSFQSADLAMDLTATTLATPTGISGGSGSSSTGMLIEPPQQLTPTELGE